MNLNTDWQRSKTNVFWGEIAPYDHILQIYEDNDAFLNVLTGFVGDGINAGDGIIVIATAANLQGLENRLRAHGINVDSLIEHGDYFPLDAEKTLAKFMVDDWPDEALFINLVTDLIANAKKGNRKVRAFGEMVAILWAQGNNGATVNLEHLWNRFCEKEAFSLFCAYPKSGFTQGSGESLIHICDSHSKMVSGSDHQSGEIIYQNIQSKAG